MACRNFGPAPEKSIEMDRCVGLKHHVTRCCGHPGGQRERPRRLGAAQARCSLGRARAADLCLDERFDKDVASEADVHRTQLPGRCQQGISRTLAAPVRRWTRA